MDKSNAQKYWWKDAKIYELYIDKFAGTIEELTLNLDYFSTLGVNTLHILPHYPSPMIDDGYDVSDYRGVRPELGTLDDFSYLLEEAHARGMRIVTDLVLNHTSSAHPWFVEARSSKTNTKRDYYLWSEKGTEFSGAPNGIPDIKVHNWIPHEHTDDFYYATFYPQQPDLNWDNAEVFEEIVSVMEYWAALGVDGFRLDAIPYLVKREGTSCKGLPETHAIIKRLRARMQELYPDVIFIAEAHDTLEETKKYFGNGDECHMAYHFVMMEEMWNAIRSGNTQRLAKIADESLAIPDNCQWVIFLRNHDEITLGSLAPDVHAALMEFLDSDRRYVFNNGTATSVRLGSIFKGDQAKILSALALLYSLPGAPAMYYGDEIGMDNLATDTSIRDSRKYVRGTFDMQQAREQIKDPESLFAAVAKLLRTGNAAVVHTDEDSHHAAII